MQGKEGEGGCTWRRGRKYEHISHSIWWECESARESEGERV